jgi:ferrochelatase
MREGLLLVNLGSPDNSSTPAVRRYLRQFLMDRHVIDMHWTFRSVLVHGVIAPFRAPKSAHAYRSIWTDNGSPLLHLTKQFVERVQAHNNGIIVELAMRYGRPTIRGAIQRLKASGIDKLKVVPLYPQFAKSSTLTAIESVIHEIERANWGVSVSFLQDFYEEPEWIENLALNINKTQAEFCGDHLLLSYHGLPEHHVQELDASGVHCLKTDDCCAQVKQVNRLCYRAQCFATSRALIKQLDWPQEQHSVSFQSRLGRRPWIKPYSDHRVIELAKSGIKRVLVTCPSFVADCLETLEEISIRLRNDFINAGGEDLKLVPALNDSDDWAKHFSEMLKRSGPKWLNPGEARNILSK